MRLAVLLLSCLAPGLSHGLAVTPGASLVDVLDGYREEGVALIYSTDLVKPTMVVRAVPARTRPREALQDILASHGLGLQAAGDVLLVVQRPDAAAPEARHGALVGVVRDRETGQRLPGASVTIRETGQRTVTRSAGDFWFNELTAGRYSLSVDVDGYLIGVKSNVEVAAGRTVVQPVSLDPFEPHLERLVVNASWYALLERMPGSFTFLDRNELENLPSLGREPLRSVNRLPGTATDGLSAQSHIRGGERDEVGVLFDGLPLQEPFHLKNFGNIFSLLNPQAIGGIEVFTGGFPAQYGNRLSGVIDVRPIRPDTRPVHELSLDLFNAGAVSNGTFRDGRGEWLASARRGNLDVATSLSSSDLGTPHYVDGLALVRYSLTDTLHLSGNAMLLDDSLSLRTNDGTETAEASHTTQYFWTTLDHEPTDTLSYRTLIAHSDIENDRQGLIDEPDQTFGEVSDLRAHSITLLKQDWTFVPSDRYVARWGFDFRRVDGNYDYASHVTFEDDPLTELLEPMDVLNMMVQTAPDGEQYGLYFSSRFRPTERFAAELGLRWDRQTYTIDGGDEQTSPRAGLMYRVARGTVLRASWGRFYQAQGINELQVEDGISRFFPAQRSEHTIFGLDHVFENGIQLRLEAYRKRMDRLRPRFENLFDPLELLPELQPDRVRIAPESAMAEGVELLIAGRPSNGPLSWWVHGSRSRVEDVIDGDEVPRSWDQPSAWGFGLTWERGAWTASLAGRYHSGWPTTEVRLASPMSELVLAPRNGARFPDYRTIDLRISRRKELADSAYTLFFEASNLTNRGNACCSEYDVEVLPDGSLTLESAFDEWLPLIPNIGVIWQF